jgi:hypothetical protein
MAPADTQERQPKEFAADTQESQPKEFAADTQESQPKEFAEDSLAINDLHCFTSSSCK